MAVSAINQHEIFSFEYTHHLLLLLLFLLETLQKSVERSALSAATLPCDAVSVKNRGPVYCMSGWMSPSF